MITSSNENNVLPSERKLRTKVAASTTCPKDCYPHLAPDC